MVDRKILYTRTSTIVPLNTSSAFWMSGSFLKSSLLNGTGAVFFSAAGAASTDLAGWVVAAGLAAGGAAGAEAAATDWRSQPGGASALINLIIALAWPNSPSLVASN